MLFHSNQHQQEILINAFAANVQKFLSGFDEYEYMYICDTKSLTISFLTPTVNTCKWLSAFVEFH